MGDYEVRNLTSDDYDAIMELEDTIFGGEGETLLCPYYVRLCTDFYNDTCFIAFHQGKPVAYCLSFVKGKEAYCTTLAVAEAYQRTRVLPLVLRKFVSIIIERDIECCWFTVKAENTAARALHASLGAKEVEVRKGFYGAGDERIVSKIDNENFKKLRAKYERRGLIKSKQTRLSA